MSVTQAREARAAPSSSRRGCLFGARGVRVRTAAAAGEGSGYSYRAARRTDDRRAREPRSPAWPREGPALRPPGSLVLGTSVGRCESGGRATRLSWEAEGEKDGVCRRTSACERVRGLAIRRGVRCAVRAACGSVSQDGSGAPRARQRACPWGYATRRFARRAEGRGRYGGGCARARGGSSRRSPRRGVRSGGARRPRRETCLGAASPGAV